MCEGVKYNLINVPTMLKCFIASVGKMDARRANLEKFKGHFLYTKFSQNYF